VSPKAIAAMARAGAIVCACPTTERNLGDGVVPVDAYFDAGVRVALGSDSQIQIDLLEDARELEYHLRLQKTARNVLAPAGDDSSSALARRLFECATISGAKSIGFNGGRLEPGAPADFFTVDLDDLSIAGSSTEDLLAAIVFSLARTAVRDVVVAGRQIVNTD
jgi:formimidoylglutamate deiminase